MLQRKKYSRFGTFVMNTIFDWSSKILELKEIYYLQFWDTISFHRAQNVILLRIINSDKKIIQIQIETDGSRTHCVIIIHNVPMLPLN